MVADALFISGLAYAQLGQLDEAWRCIDEAMTAGETTKERWWEAEVNRIGGEIALESPDRIWRKRKPISSVRSRSREAAGKVLGATRGDEHGAALARSGQA